mgnify:CR=1 FL=1
MNIRFTAKGITCKGCADIIKSQAKEAKASHIEIDVATGKGTVEFDEKETSTKRIFASIEKKGYECIEGWPEKPGTKPGYAWVLIFLGILIVVYFIYTSYSDIGLPSLSPQISYALLFAVGLLTGFHCIAMCGGFVLGYTAKDRQEGRNSYMSHLKYGMGKILSYTIIGALFGLLGSIIAFTPKMRGIAGIIAGIFLLLFGLRMLNVFPTLGKLGFRTAPFITRRLYGKSPIVIGLLNGLMIACGPLQAVYLMAAASGSMLEGAKLLFIFALGTLPVMLGFAYLTSYVTARLNQSLLKASGVIVMVMGLIMVNNGLVLTGTGYDVGSMVVASEVPNFGAEPDLAEKGYQEIRMEVLASGWNPDRFILKKGVPVRWIIDGKEITGCNNAIIVPQLGLEFKIKQGEQIIEFTPPEKGVIPWSCWMGMIHGQFIVVEGGSDQTVALTQTPTLSRQGGCGCKA